MGQVLHGSARTTEVVRRAIQHSEESLRTLAKRHGVNQKTIAKWKKRGSTADLPTGPKDPTSTSLSIEEEAVVVAFRRHTLLPLDDCLSALQPTIPQSVRRAPLFRVYAGRSRRMPLRWTPMSMASRTASIFSSRRTRRSPRAWALRRWLRASGPHTST